MRFVLAVCLTFVATGAALAQEKPPQPLPNVPVTAEAELVRNAKLREFDRRRSMGMGQFITEAELEKDQHRQLSDVLKRLRGVAMVRSKGTRGGSSSAVYLISSRGSATLMHESPVFGKNCPIAIWLDGVPVYRGLDRGAVSNPAFPSRAPSKELVQSRLDEPPFDINSIMTNHVAAIEFYTGPATMPAELNITQGTCGALVIWTK